MASDAPPRTAADLLRRVAADHPDREAYVHGEKRVTYAWLDRAADGFAATLIDRGVAPGDKVAIYSWDRPEWLDAMLGAYKARAVPVNVNYRYVADEVRYILDNSGSVAVVFERAFAPVVEAVRRDLPQLCHLIVLDDGSDAPTTPDAVSYEEAVAAASPTREFPPRSPDDLYLLYTGGTTGVPKGVMWRAEDIFFGALGGGGIGNEITRPEEIADRAREGRTRCLPACRPPALLPDADGLHPPASPQVRRATA